MLVAVLLSGSGCHRDLVRLAEQERYDEVIERAESSRFTPHGRAARAYAEALLARARVDQARDVLLRDFRRGGDLLSLVALADLELALGRRGMAALHYERGISIDPELLRGRPDVCALLRERATVLVEHGQGLAAEDTLERAKQTCGPVPNEVVRLDVMALDQEIDRVADAQVRTRVAQTRCPSPDCAEVPVAERIAAHERALAEAAKAGPAALWKESQRQQASVSPEQLVEILLAELRGELGEAPLLDGDVALLVGEQPWSELAPAVMSRSPAEAAWLQLRLAPVVIDMPIAPAPRTGADQHDRWADRAQTLDRAQGWRVEALRGDLGSAELELAASLRPPAGAPEPSPSHGTASVLEPEAVAPEIQTQTAPEPSDDAAATGEAGHAPDHWLARAELDSQSLPGLLTVARLRRAAGRTDLALQATRYLLTRAHREGLSVAPRWAAIEAGRALAWGRFWEALAIAEAIESDQTRAVAAAAANALVLARIFCDGECKGDEDQATTARVMGEAWMQEQTQRLERLATSSVQRTSLGRSGCPSVAELLAPEAVGPLPETLRLVREQPDSPQVGRALIAAMESEAALICAPQVVLPLLAQGGHELSAARLAEYLAHVPEVRSSYELQAHAELAMVAQQGERAELLSTAAAAVSDDPRRTWIELARMARATGSRDLELSSLRQVLLHTPGLEDDVVRAAMVVHGLRDRQRSWAEQETPAGAEATRRHVSTWLERHPASQRFALRAALARQVAREGWLEPEAIDPVVEALFPTEVIRQRHDRIVASLRGESAAKPRSVLDVAGWADLARRGRVQEIPPALEVFADPSRAEALRLALAEDGKVWELRWRSAIGLIVHASPAARLRGMLVLRTMLADDARRRRGMLRWWSERPAAVQPEGVEHPRDLAATTIVDEQRILFALAFGLDLEPWLMGY